ncbi:MAG: hypothetical protein L6W00_10950 [Lentisphaeria bacterium]|nr:MAG: hypothetical protein L6W00_10950 [Lentisphaeria bacterium]
MQSKVFLDRPRAKLRKTGFNRETGVFTAEYRHPDAIVTLQIRLMPEEATLKLIVTNQSDLPINSIFPVPELAFRLNDRKLLLPAGRFPHSKRRDAIIVTTGAAVPPGTGSCCRRRTEKSSPSTASRRRIIAVTRRSTTLTVIGRPGKSSGFLSKPSVISEKAKPGRLRKSACGVSKICAAGPTVTSPTAFRRA